MDGGNSNPVVTFVKTFFSGVLHGDRQPGQSFSACVNQNISNTTGGVGQLLGGKINTELNPQKLAQVIPAASVGVAGALLGKVPFKIPFDPGTGGISAFTGSAYGLGRALGVGGVAMGGLVGAANGVGRDWRLLVRRLRGYMQDRPSIVDRDTPMAKENPIRAFFTKKSNPVGDLLGRILSPWVARLFRDHPEDYKHVKAYEDKFDDWVRRNLRVTDEPPELWKSLLLY